MNTLREIIKKINMETGFAGELRFDEPLSAHTTFKVGGPADLWIKPRGDQFPRYGAVLLKQARSYGIPVFILGGGANIVVSDRGIRGIVLDTSGWSGCSVLPRRDGDGAAALAVRSGTPVDAAAEAAADLGLGGLEFLAGMPGSAGGAVWMNARCYGASVSDILEQTEFLDADFSLREAAFGPEDFSYKKSPFQSMPGLILSARFRLLPREPGDIRAEMAKNRRDREQKGHYRYPSAGSVFKNNRAWGKPTGQIIDELGLRGLRQGGAAVADYHGNIIVNTGNAAAADIRGLVETLRDRVYTERGIGLEPEILFVGDWERPFDKI
ncbi:MAG: UDP-N-acetylmuramate dehydrogenase [Spirochaetaceae bacterium]|jgi:UDP-N-acetylmuramate dehydrogenase|nr:UDP-N-acetylmuramate dehydrogenase [Spirochaetaceae bacterium]